MQYFKSIFIIVLSMLFFSSCDPAKDKQIVKIVEKETSLEEYILGYSNKLWVLKKHTMEGKNQTPSNREKKLFFGFYGDKTFRLGPMKAVNQFEVHKGKFKVNEKDSIIVFQFDNTKIGMDERKVIEATHKSLIISSLGGEEIMSFEPIDKPLPEDVLSL